MRWGTDGPSFIELEREVRRRDTGLELSSITGGPATATGVGPSSAAGRAVAVSSPGPKLHTFRALIEAWLEPDRYAAREHAIWPSASGRLVDEDDAGVADTTVHDYVRVCCRSASRALGAQPRGARSWLGPGAGGAWVSTQKSAGRPGATGAGGSRPSPVAVFIQVSGDPGPTTQRSSSVRSRSASTHALAPPHSRSGPCSTSPHRSTSGRRTRRRCCPTDRQAHSPKGARRGLATRPPRRSSF